MGLLVVPKRWQAGHDVIGAVLGNGHFSRSCPHLHAQVGRHGYSCKVAPKHSSVVGKPDKDATKKEPKLTPRESSEEEPPSLFLHRLARVPKARYISEKVASPPRGSFWKQQAGALSSLPLLTDSRKRKGGDSSVVL